ncbi:MAG: methionyl-tRNA formyltransferase [Elusimicrobia bacterium RIFOXYA2_FULL_40_6]|nr:MAG: methionyl-tRNA formyltransferase [Elusimicrobia bacterium RIFOXYA2_FULL_40_6]
MNIIFYGSNETSVKFLEHLITKDTIAAVVTRQDKPSGRGLEMHSSPVKDFARKKKLKLVELDSLPSSNLDADLGVAVAYGRILKKDIYSFPKNGTINVHFSLLPKYRGASPMQWALINGEKTTGVTIFFIDEGLDTGKVILQKEVIIEENDDFISLQDKLVKEGVILLGEAVELINNKNFVAGEQTGTPTLAPPLKKSDGRIDWTKKTPAEICNLIKGTTPWPGAYTEMNVEENKLLKILKASLIEPDIDEAYSRDNASIPGEIVAVIREKGFVVKCRNGFLLVENVQRQNKRPSSAWAFWQGAHMKIGDRFSEIS